MRRTPRVLGHDQDKDTEDYDQHHEQFSA